MINRKKFTIMGKAGEIDWWYTAATPGDALIAYLQLLASYMACDPGSPESLSLEWHDNATLTYRIGGLPVTIWAQEAEGEYQRVRNKKGRN
jgi:hypothetical protein